MLICVVDDDPVFQFLCKAHFTHCAKDVDLLFFANGKEALENLATLHSSGHALPKLILVDINMPIMDGWELIDQLEKLSIFEQSHLYVVSSSIAASDQYKSLSKRLVKDYLKKPLSMADFQRIFQEALQL